MADQDWEKRAKELWESSEAFDMGHDTPCMFTPKGPRRDGYVRVSIGPRQTARSIYAHRLMYEAMVGEIPSGLQIDHLCRQRACVNPWHMEPVPLGINVLRGVGITAIAARRTACAKGHVYSQENTHIRTNGSRRCRTCEREGWRRRNQ